MTVHDDDQAGLDLAMRVALVHGPAAFDEVLPLLDALAAEPSDEALALVRTGLEAALAPEDASFLTSAADLDALLRRVRRLQERVALLSAPSPKGEP